MIEKHSTLESIYQSISLLCKKYLACKVILFGSRSRGDNNDRSDIDLAIYGMPDETRSQFWSDLEDLPTLLKFDVVHIDKNTNDELLRNIEKDGVTLYEKD